jgi:hypothetical protein
MTFSFSNRDVRQRARRFSPVDAASNVHEPLGILYAQL